MSPMIADSKLLLDHQSHPLRGPDLSSKTERFGSLRQQRRQLRPLLGTQFGLSPWRWLMPQGLNSLRPGFLEPLAHRSLTDSECGGDVLLFPSLFMQFPGTHPSSFAPIFGRCRFLVHTSFSRHFSFVLYISRLRSISIFALFQSTSFKQRGVQTETRQ
jgi:hypothetical protein